MARTTSLAEDVTRKQILDSSDDDTDPATDDTDQSSDQPPATDQTADQQPDQPVQSPASTIQPQLASQIPDPVVGPGGGLTYDFSQPQQPQPAVGGGGQAVTGAVELPESTGGLNVTHYGYPGDASWDDNSGKGVGDADNQLVSGYSTALSRSARQSIFGVDSTQSTGREFQYGGKTYRDDDTSPSRTANIDIYDPNYEGIDPGVSQDVVDQRRQIQGGAGGGAQGVADFFIKRGDSPITDANDPRLTDVTVGNQDWRVNSEAAPYFQGFLSDLATAGAPTRSDGGWNYREKVGAKGLSSHAYGGAIDVNQEGRDEVTPEFNAWIKANPGVLQSLENKWNIYGGERFGDLGHFEWNGVTAAKAQPMQVPRAGGAPQSTAGPTQVAHPQTWDLGDPVISSEDLNYQQQREQQNDNQQVAQLAQATQGEQSVPGLINKLDDPKYLPDVSPSVKAQYKQSLQNELTTEAQQTFNEPDPQKAYDKAMGNANLFTPFGETARLFQAYSAKAFNAWNQSAQTGEENTINQFINLINPNATPEQKVDFYKDLTDPSRSADDRTHHVMALYSQIDPQVSATIPPQNLLDAVDRQSDPQFVKQRQDFLKNEEAQIVQREQVDPRLQGTAAGNTAQFVARMGTTLAQFGANPLTAVTGGSIMASELLQDTKQRIAQEHPEMSPQDVKALAETSTTAQIIPQVAVMMMPGGMLEKAFGGQLAGGISNPVIRLGARALIHTGIASGIGSTGQIAQNLVEGKPIMQDVPQAALQTAPYGLLGALHGGEAVRPDVAPETRPEVPAPTEAAPEIPSPPATRPVTGGEVLGPERYEVTPTTTTDPIAARIAEGQRVLTPSLLQEAIQNLPEKLPADELTRRIQEIQGAELEAPREVRYEPGTELPQPGAIYPVGENPLEAFAREQRIAQEQQPVTTEPEQVTQPSPSIINLTGMGKGIVAGMRDAMWEKVQRGETTEAGAPSSLLLKAAELKAAGKLNTREDFEQLADAYNRFLQGKTTPEVQPEGGKPAPVTGTTEPYVSEIANRYVQPKVQPGDIPPTKGYSTQELINRGLKMTPEQINQHVSDVMNGKDPVTQGAALRAEEARLSQRSMELSKVADADPTNTQARIDADNAHKDWLDFHNGPIARVKNIFHGLGQGLQKEVPVDLSTFNGLREKWFQDLANDPKAQDPVTGKVKEPSEQMQEVMRRMAKGVNGADEDLNGSKARFTDAIDKAKSSRSIEETKRRIMEKLEVQPCIVVGV